MEIDLDISSLWNLKESLEDAVCDFLRKKAKRVEASEVGLDERCGRIWVTESFIVSRQGNGNIEYYGGFEYVGKEDKVIVGDYTFYGSDDSRVAGHIDLYFDNHPDADEETEDDDED